MELLKFINDAPVPVDTSNIHMRDAARAIVFDENKLMPILYVSKHEYHKLPWWWIDKWETKETWLIRECMEEVGCEITIAWEVWKIIEYRKEENKLQTSYCYYWDILNKSEPQFTDLEISNGFQVIRVGLDEAIAILESDKPKSYEWIFIQERDLVFLKKLKAL